LERMHALKTQLGILYQRKSKYEAVVDLVMGRGMPGTA